MMKEKNNATTSSLKRILVNCSAQAKQYGSCVASKVPEIERDMCSKEFITLKCCMQRVVFSWKTTPYNPSVAPSSDPISEGSVLSIRYSLDLKLLAIQRSSHKIEIWNRETGKAFSQRCRSDSEKILGFFWIDCAVCDIVFVKISGLELYSYDADSQSLHLVETKKLSISWYIYTHESRLVLLASGMQCETFTGYQLLSAGTMRLPMFEMAVTKSEMDSKPILVAEDVHIITFVSLEKLKVQPNTYVLMVQVLSRDDNYAELGMLIKIIDPSREEALQFLESGRQNF